MALGSNLYNMDLIKLVTTGFFLFSCTLSSFDTYRCVECPDSIPRALQYNSLCSTSFYRVNFCSAR
jgi:hypothetical protein